MINILPYSQKKMIDRMRMIRVASTTIWALVLLIGAAMLLLVPLLMTINSRFAITSKQIEELERSGVVINPVNIAALQARSQALSEKLAAPPAPSPTDYIAIVRSVQTSGITLSGYSMEKTGALVLEASGTASSRESLQRFINALEKSEQVAAVESPVSNYVRSTNSPFSVTITFK